MDNDGNSEDWTVYTESLSTTYAMHYLWWLRVVVLFDQFNNLCKSGLLLLGFVEESYDPFKFDTPHTLNSGERCLASDAISFVI